MLLNLLERDSSGGDGSVEIGNTYWRLVTHDLDTSDVETIPFICASYAWGKVKESSAFHPSFEVSIRTKPIVAAIVARRPLCTRIWVDAFCVPLEEHARIHTLQSMGYIYSLAQEVVAVLSSATQPVIKQMAESDRLTDAEHLKTLESDDWISRAWTYQEAVNSRRFAITCEGPGDWIVEGSHFLNCLGFTLTRFQEAPYSSQDGPTYPRLDTFQDLIADYMIAAYQERSALQVMSNMDRRDQENQADHFYAMMGAISNKCSSFADTVDACEAFMAMCEKKGDYSFIYSSTERNPAPKRRWRPLSNDLLPAVLSWHCFGDPQPAHEEDGSLYLDDVLVVEPHHLTDTGIEFLEDWVRRSKFSVSRSGGIESMVSLALECMGFRGSFKGIPTKNGLFFPVGKQPFHEGMTIIVATKVRWTFGAPGLICIREEGEEVIFVPGVFFGFVDNKGATSFKLS